MGPCPPNLWEVVLFYLPLVPDSGCQGDFLPPKVASFFGNQVFVGFEETLPWVPDSPKKEVWYPG